MALSLMGSQALFDSYGGCTLAQSFLITPHNSKSEPGSVTVGTVARTLGSKEVHLGVHFCT